jgi:RND family efflux transporter MFP subunit
MRSKKLTYTLSALMFAGLGFLSPLMADDIDALTVPKHDLKIGFAIDGRVGQMNVKSGQQVKKGQVIAELVDEEGKTMLAEYEILVNSDLEVQSAKAKHDLAKVELKRVQDLAKKSAAAIFEVTRAEASEKVASIEWELTKRKQKELREQYNRAIARHDEYVMRAPMDSVVEQLTVDVGESVERTKPIIRLVVIDPLWINAPVPTQQTMKLKLGDPAWIIHRLEGQEKPVQGKIIWIASVADPASDTRSIRIEVPNPQGLPAGSHVGVRFTAEPTNAKTVSAQGVK